MAAAGGPGRLLCGDRDGGHMRGTAVTPPSAMGCDGLVAPTEAERDKGRDASMKSLDSRSDASSPSSKLRPQPSPRPNAPALLAFSPHLPPPRPRARRPPPCPSRKTPPRPSIRPVWRPSSPGRPARPAPLCTPSRRCAGRPPATRAHSQRSSSRTAAYVPIPPQCFCTSLSHHPSYLYPPGNRYSCIPHSA